MRWKWAVPAVVIAVAGIWLWRRSGDPPATADATADTANPEVAARTRKPTRTLPVPTRTLPLNHDPMIYQPPGAPPLTQKEGTAVLFAPMTEYKYDPEQMKAEALEYKQYRLRFKLADAAAECYDGGDAPNNIQLSYTMVVRDEQLTIENLKVVDSTLTDPALERCIVSSVGSMKSAATGLPDSRQDNDASISLHDLFVRNRAAKAAP